MIKLAVTAFWLALLASNAAAETRLGGASDINLPLTRVLLALAVFGFVAGTAALAKRGARFGFSRRVLSFTIAGGRALFQTPALEVRVCERQRLSNQAELLRLHWAGHDYLVILGVGSIALIDKRTRAPDEATP